MLQSEPPDHSLNDVPMPKNPFAKPPTISKSKIRFARDYSPLPWTDFFDRVEYFEDSTPVYIAGDQGPLFFCLHGAGLSALSFAALARELKSDCTVVSFDWRGHGASRLPADDMSQESLLTDAMAVLEFVSNHPEFSDRTILVAGHSMGGAIASKLVTRLAATPEKETLFKKVRGYFVIDVVEGSALEVLPMME